MDRKSLMVCYVTNLLKKLAWLRIISHFVLDIGMPLLHLATVDGNRVVTAWRIYFM